MSYINCDSKIRIFRESSRNGTTSTNLFLSGGNTNDFCLKRIRIFFAFFCKPSCGFEYSISTCLIIKSSCYPNCPIDELKALIINACITYRNESFGFSFTFYTNINPYFMRLWDFFRSSGLIKCMARFPVTPLTTPFSVRMAIRLPEIMLRS